MFNSTVWTFLKQPRLYPWAVSVVTCLLMGSFFQELRPDEKVATVDVTGLVNQFVKAELASHKPKDAMEQDVKHFSHTLETALKEMAEQKQVVILPKEAVITGAIDLTPKINQTLQKALAEGRET